MRTLEILTAQNVTIEYNLGELSERIFAFLLDILIITGSAFVISFFLYPVLPERYVPYAYLFAVTPIAVFYSLASEYFGNGQSWGKKVMGLKVVKINGNEIRMSDYLARWVFRLVDIYLSAGVVAMFLISSTNRSQRLGDIVANTAVIRIKPLSSPKLDQIEKLKSLDDYTPTYTQVVIMSEEEMVLIKNAIDEAKKYPNKSHLRHIDELTEILCQRLKIQPEAGKEKQFLQTLINDYIVLTR